MCDVLLFYQQPPKEFSAQGYREERTREPSPLAATGNVKTIFNNKTKVIIMAHSNNSVITGKFQGTLGKELVFREWEGKTVVAKAPRPRKGDPTEAQTKTQENFLLGSRYAKAIIGGDNPDLFDGYQSILKPRQNVYSRALEDFMTLPKVTSITTRTYKGLVGDRIIVRAKDDFRVTGLRVEIYSAGGVLLEDGEAQVDKYGLDWTYTATQTNNLLAGTVIKAIATDVPNNEGTLEFTL